MSDDYAAEMETAANAVLPPLGSVFENVSGSSEGPPMMRMFLMQAAFAALAKAGRLTRRAKVLVIAFICSCLVARDLANFFKARGTTIYEQIGVPRQASIYQFEEAFSQYKLCIDYDDECKDTAMTSPIYKLDAEQVEEIKYVVSDPALKELYDKTETFIRKKTR